MLTQKVLDKYWSAFYLCQFRGSLRPHSPFVRLSDASTFININKSLHISLMAPYLLFLLLDRSEATAFS